MKVPKRIWTRTLLNLWYVLNRLIEREKKLWVLKRIWARAWSKNLNLCKQHIEYYSLTEQHGYFRRKHKRECFSKELDLPELDLSPSKFLQYDQGFCPSYTDRYWLILLDYKLFEELCALPARRFPPNIVCSFMIWSRIRHIE